MSQQEIPQKAATLNKPVGGVVAGLGGATIATGVVALLHLHYPTFPPEGAAAIGGVVAAALSGIATFFIPIATALQRAMIRKLDDTK